MLGITVCVKDLLVGVVTGAVGRFPGSKARLPATRIYNIVGETEAARAGCISQLLDSLSDDD